MTHTRTQPTFPGPPIALEEAVHLAQELMRRQTRPVPLTKLNNMLSRQIAGRFDPAMQRWWFGSFRMFLRRAGIKYTTSADGTFLAQPVVGDPIPEDLRPVMRTGGEYLGTAKLNRLIESYGRIESSEDIEQLLRQVLRAVDRPVGASELGYAIALVAPNDLWAERWFGFDTMTAFVHHACPGIRTKVDQAVNATIIEPYRPDGS